MSGGNGLRLLGSPDVRNAILLNEIGVLVHSVGMLSREFIEKETAFPHHLVLRRLTRGSDPRLASEDSLFSALHVSLSALLHDADRKAVAHELLTDMAGSRLEISSSHAAFGEWVDRALLAAIKKCDADHIGAFDQVAHMVRQVSADLAWQREQEEAIGAIEPSFISVQGFYDGLDQLPFVADLVEMKGRTWHPESLLPPEVRLLRVLQEGEKVMGRPRTLEDEVRLSEVRELYCEVLANQLLEINNIRKDGPGDLGSWFWKARLHSAPQAAMTVLRRFDDGATLQDEEREAVRWLGLRPISEWAYGKVVLWRQEAGMEISLWEHTRRLASLHKSAIVQALITERWPDPSQIAWRMLGIGFGRTGTDTLDRVKELVEVEYPLGNELCRDGNSIRFTFPGLEDEHAEDLVGQLEREIVDIAGSAPQISLSPAMKGRQGIAVEASERTRLG